MAKITIQIEDDHGNLLNEHTYDFGSNPSNMTSLEDKNEKQGAGLKRAQKPSRWSKPT